MIYTYNLRIAFRKMRNNLGISQQQIDTDMGYEKSRGAFTSNFERGTSVIPLGKIAIIAEKYNFDIKILQSAYLKDCKHKFNDSFKSVGEDESI